MSDLETKKYLFDRLTKWSNLHWLTEVNAMLFQYVNNNTPNVSIHYKEP